MGTAAAAVVLADHRRTLAVLDAPLLPTAARLFALLAQSDHMVTRRRATYPSAVLAALDAEPALAQAPI